MWPSSDAKKYSLIGRQPLRSPSLQRGDPAQDVLDELEDLGARIATAIPLDRIVETPVLGLPQNLPLVARPQRVDHGECS